ncbi:MAG TPA: hypothetical protein VL360_03300 [Gammaproteobacteria bacterium]|nr:hypothetical protein [Gammaproteobacteria bacterium]
MQARNPLWDAVEAVANGTLNPDVPDANGNSLIFQVIATGNVKMLDALLNTDKVNLKLKNSDDQSPVQYCNAMADKIGAQRKQDNILINKMDNLEQIDVPPEEYQRLQQVRKQQSASGDDPLADAVFRSMRQSILIKSQVIAEAKSAQSNQTTTFVERKDVSKGAQDLVTQMQIIKEWASIAEKSYKSFINETDPKNPSNNKLLETKAINHVTKFCNLVDKCNADRAAFNKECAKSKNGKDEFAYVSAAYKEYMQEAMPTKDLEQKLKIDTVARREKAQLDASPLLPPKRSKSDPVSKTKARSSSFSGNEPTRGRSDSSISAKEGNSTGALFKKLFKNQSHDAIRNDLAASAEAASKEESPKIEKAQPAAASPKAAHKPTPDPESEKQQETVQSPGIGRK